MTLIMRERPRGHVVRALRVLAGLTQKELAELLHTETQNIKNWEKEKNGALMPESIWLLMRITGDPHVREQWNRSLERKR